MSLTAAMKSEIFEGKTALKDVLNSSSKEWTIVDLRNTAAGDRKAGVMAIALMQLELDNFVEIDHDKRTVRKI